METLLLKLQADIDARKRRRSDAWPTIRFAGLLVLLFAVGFELGTRSGDGAWPISAVPARLPVPSGRVEALRGQIDAQTVHIERLEQAVARSARYGIPADLAMAIEDIARAEGVDPNLAFELVRVESEFKQRAVSPVGAVGYTQLMPATARLLLPGITERQMFERETNLRLGFRFLRSLIRQYDGDLRLALLAYNRGPITVDRLLAAGVDPNNGYPRLVLGR